MPVLADQQEITYNSSVWTQDVFGSLLPVAVGRGRLTCILGSQHSCHARYDQHRRASGDRLPGSNPPQRCLVYRLAHEALLFRGMPMGPEEYQVRLGYGPAPWPTLKDLVPHSTVWWSAWQIPVVWKTCRERWMIGKDREGESQGNPC